MPNDDWFINANEVYDLLMKQAMIDSQPRAIRRAARMVIEFPADAVEPVKHGRWEKARRRGCVSYADGYAECSECHGKPTFGGGDMKYCPNCGAKMDAEPPKGEQNG